METYRHGRRTLVRALLMIVLLAVPVLALTGCGSGGGSAGSSPSSNAMSDPQILAIGKELAQCLRQHGVPNLPDPTVNNGRLILPDAGMEGVTDAQMNTAMQACQSIRNKLPASAFGGAGQPSQAPLTADDLAKLRKFAECMRGQGLSDFPDPGPDGNFDLAKTSLADQANAQKIHAALKECKQYQVGNSPLLGGR